MVHIYCGDGKGKTTAAVGLAVRFAGAGGKVLFFQFLKDNSSSERRILGQIENITVLEGCETMKFVFQMSEEEKEQLREYYEEKLKEITKLTEEYGKQKKKQQTKQMVILDEVIGAVSCNLVREDEVLSFLRRRPDNLEVVLTGRNPGKKLLAEADYVTEMKKIRHPYDSGTAARKGIEF